MTVVLAPAEETVLRRLLPDLVRLSPAARLEAVSRLVESMQAEAVTELRKPQVQLSGVWADNGESAEEIADQIRAARHFARPTADLD